MPKSFQPDASVARTRLRAVGLLGAVGVSLAGVYAMTGVGLPCPWRYLTHTLCPFCGSTHLGVALLHGDFAGAWAANPFVFVLLAGTLVASVFWTVELLGGPAVRLPGRLRDQRYWYAALGVVAIAFAVARNL